jgi:chromosome segregation protein
MAKRFAGRPMAESRAAGGEMRDRFVKISRLRLLGFKSFIEPTELLVEPGLTGVVGPNGCGKSNLLEALRWVMGETSYKTMRASAMEDVIFAGTTNRPARNMAEVTIFIDNSERKAPAEFNDTDILEVSRRIERDAGSAFKINGKDVRARDVRLLFEDAATGARSPALVRQGRIGEIVNAKPQDRRRILEDAAGIAGLHSRRHEAELRLKAAESNLERLGDLTGQMTTQMNSLKRQARQARRYKEISVDIRQAEALQHYFHWSQACAQVNDAEAALEESVRAVARLTKEEAEALRAQGEAADALEPLREEEAKRAAVLHRLTVERETLDEEEARTLARQEELEERRVELERDLEREREAATEADEILARLKDEEEQLAIPDGGSAEAEDEARAAVEERAETLEAEESALSDVTGALADARAKRTQLEETARRQRQRIDEMEQQLADLDSRLDALKAERGAETDFDALQNNVQTLSGALAAADTDATAAKDGHADARRKESEAHEAATQARLRAQELETEVQTLTKLLKPAENAEWLPIVQHVRATPGYEMALGAALGDDLDASDDEAAPAHWGASDASGDPTLPAGAKALSEFVGAPKVLARRLAQIGVVDRSEGDTLQASLKPGQRLVSREGDLWRWDGYAAAAEAPTAAAKRLAERNRLDDLTKQAEVARTAAADSEAKREAARSAAEEAEKKETAFHTAWRAAQSALDEARDALAAAEHATQETNEAFGALTEARKRTAGTLEEAREAESEARTALDGLDEEDSLASELEDRQYRVSEARSAYSQARATLDGLEREAQMRAARLEAIAGERERWTKRKGSADLQIETLGERIHETSEELAGFADLPERIAARRSKLLDAITEAEGERQQAADALAEADTRRRQCDEALREAQGALSQAREGRARVEAQLEAARERRTEQARAITEQLECRPEECLELAGYEDDSDLPSADEVDWRIAKLKADRERLGGVNLRAEEEVSQIAAELESMENERVDLEEAIVRLRQGISSLNREGRKRLLDAFDEVNEHFKQLFQTLFGGGEAELQLVESDDPLESGLEIIAQPPGKKSQVLTLLSGGEKALTALALIFAVFLTNPSPICVLDEVDAPLDDTNVERFCKLMDEMARVTDTRFLIITHHPMTMARMNRLFGVTMAERGVSQLVSVDLEAAERYREAG